MATGAVSEANGKGRHVTSHRELFMLEGGAILIDNPGLREVGMAESGEGLDRTFEEITRLAASCRYQDCSHLHEAGCAVLEAVRTGELEESVYQNYVKLKKEIGYFEASRAELRRKDKDFGHMMKTYHRDARLKKF
jgi:ribosome biogenesis GTPase